MQSPKKLKIEIRDEPESAEFGANTRQITEGDAPYGSEASPQLRTEIKNTIRPDVNI